MPDDNTSVTVDGFQFETLMPERHISASSEISFGVRIINQTATPQQFLLFWLQPVFFKKNAQWEQICHLGSNANGTSFPRIWDCQMINPGKSTDFLMKGKFNPVQRTNNLRWFSYQDKGRAFHSWEHFQTGTHGLQCEYNTSNLKWYLDHYAKNSNDSRWVGMKNSWIGEVITPLIEFQLM